MSDKNPIPSVSQANGKVCPVCGTRTYSHGGIHPQCAVNKADAPRTEKLKEARKREANAAKPSTWTQKKCPKCGSESHVRRKVCDCGRSFF